MVCLTLTLRVMIISPAKVDEPIKCRLAESQRNSVLCADARDTHHPLISFPKQFYWFTHLVIENKLLNKCCHSCAMTKKGSPYSIIKRRVVELIPVLGSQPAGDASHKLGGRLPLLSASLAVTPATLKRAATNFAAWRTEAQWV